MAEQGTDIQRLEHALGGYKVYPGTEVMKDVEGIEFVKSGKGVLVPQPSNESHDPLNWSRFWKAGAITNSVLLGFWQGFGPLALSSQVPYYMQEWDVEVDAVIRFIGVAILVLGFSNFFWIPLATAIGRRNVAIFSSLICLAACIWRAEAKTYGSFMGATVLNGFGAGPAETLPPVVIADTCFIDNRGWWNGLYWWAYFGSLMIGPVVAGVMSDKYGWRSFWWLNVAAFAVLIIMIIVWQPETKFDRSHLTKADFTEDEDKPNGETEHVEKDHADVERHVDTHLGKGKPARWQFKLWQPVSDLKKAFIQDVWCPWYLFSFPIVENASFAVSWSSSCFLVLNLSQSLVFAAPPYNFSAAAVGYTNLAVLGGAILGLFTAGPLSDLMMRVLTRRNNMIREPEMRLWSLAPFCVLLAIGTGVVASGYQNQWDWKIIVILGYGAIGWQVAGIPPISISYAIDSYKPAAGPFLVSMTVNKNLWGFGVSEFLVPWIQKDGFIAPFWTNTALCLFFTIVGAAICLKWGKTFRKWTANSFVHRLEE